MITEDTLREWETLAARATPGPWESRPGHEDSGLIHYDVEVKGRVDRVCSCWESDAGNLPRKANAAFIAASRTAVPALVAEVRRLREALRGLVEAAHQYDDAKAHEVGLCDAVTQDDHQGSNPDHAPRVRCADEGREGEPSPEEIVRGPGLYKDHLICRYCDYRSRCWGA